jgi:hypothetical protein
MVITLEFEKSAGKVLIKNKIANKQNGKNIL